MEHPNTLWLLGTCVAVPSVIYFIILLGDQGVLRLTYKRLKLRTKFKAGPHSTSVVATLTTSDIDLSCHSRQPASTTFSEHMEEALIGLASSNEISSLARSRCCSPLLSACGSTAGSIAGSTTGSHSSVHSDSDGEHDDHTSYCSHSGASHCSRPLQSSSAVSTSAPTSPIGPTPNDQHRPPLRSAMRRPCVTLTTSPSAGQHTKSVSFKAGGAVICSPPTEVALGLLAAGAPPLPVLCSRSPCSSQSTEPLTQETVGSSIASRPRTSPQIAAQPSDNTSCSLASASTNTPFVEASRATACTRPLVPACTTQSRASSRGAHLEARTTLSDTVNKSASLKRSTCAGLERLERMERMTVGSDAAHELARARAETGRRRVMAALAAARDRHAHLGGRSSPVPAGGWLSHDAAVHGTGREQYTTDLQQQWLHSQGREDYHYQAAAGRATWRLTRLPNLPLASRDSEILAVGYAPPTELVTAVAAAGKAATGLGSLGGQGAVQLAQHDVGTRTLGTGGALTATVGRRYDTGAVLDGLSGVLAAVGMCEGGAGALRDVLVADRIRLADMLTKQSYQL